jgi:RimJ/RimL family protein N-acetyltransferase
MDVTVTPAVPDNAESLLAYLEALLGENLETILRMPALPTLEMERRWIAMHAEQRNSVLLVAWDGEGAVAGILNADGYAHPQTAHAAKIGMSVRADLRGKGIGTRLLDGLFSWARSAGLHRIELEVVASNEGAIRLYQRTGFKEEGRKQSAVRVDERFLDLVLMAKRIGEGA